MILQKVHRSEIKPAEYNPRKITDEAKRKLALSLTEFDLVEPLVWNQRSGNLVGGHQRLFILDERNGSDYEVDVSVVDLPPAKEKALNVALNNQNMAGEWDFPKLKDLITEIDTGELDIEITGFNYEELEKIIGFVVSETPAPNLKNGDRPNFQQMTFTLHDEQVKEVNAALSRAKDTGGVDSQLNDNSNGNALALICRAFLNGQG